MGEKRNVYRLLVGKSEGKRPLGRLRHRWIDNIKRDLLEIGLGVVDWIGLAQDRYRWRALVITVVRTRVRACVCVQMMDKVHNPSNSDNHTPSSESFRV
jgi:hypothetical protein